MAKATAPASDSFTNLVKSLEIQFEKFIMAPLLSFLGAFFSFILWPLRSFWWLLKLFGAKVTAYASSSWDQLMRIYHQPGVDFHGMVSKVTTIPSSCMSELLLFFQRYILELVLVLGPMLLLATLFYLVLKRYGPDAEHMVIEGLPIKIYFFLFLLTVFVATAIAAFNNIENIQWALQLLPSSITGDVIVVGIALFLLALGVFIAFFGDREGGPQHPFVIAMEDWALLLVRTLTAPLRWLWAITFGRTGTSASETAALRLQLADSRVQLAASRTYLAIANWEFEELRADLAHSDDDDDDTDDDTDDEGDDDKPSKGTSAIDGEMEALRVEMAALRAQMVALEIGASTSAGEMAALRAQMADLSVQLAALGTGANTGEIADLKVQLAGLKAQQAAVNADIETLEAKLLGGDDESPGAPAVPEVPVVPHSHAAANLLPTEK